MSESILFRLHRNKPLLRTVAIAAFSAYAGMSWGWYLGHGDAEWRELEIRRSRTPGWIEVYRHGKLESEWGEHKDAALWIWLDKLLREAPSL